jgi:sialidase-1
VSLAGGAWHHVGLTYDGTQLALYVDGVQRKTRAASGFIFSSTAPLNLGAIHNGRARLSGDLDEVRIYDRALSTEEMIAHFERRKFVGSGLEPVGTRVGGKEGP